MGVEIERKFRVQPEWRPTGDGVVMDQGYLCSDPERTVRVRQAGRQAWLTIKGATQGARRAEFEYAIPVADAEALLALCPHRVQKIRHRIPVGSHVFEVDVFAGANAGLIVAEVELSDEAEAFERPPWLAAEVTDDPRYFNSALAAHPYRDWSLA